MPLHSLRRPRTLTDFVPSEVSLVDRGAVRRAFAIVKAEAAAAQSDDAVPAPAAPLQPIAGVTEDRVSEIVADAIAKALGHVTPSLTALTEQVAKIVAAQTTTAPAAPAVDQIGVEVLKALTVLTERLGKIEEQGRPTAQPAPEVIAKAEEDSTSVAASLLMSMRK